MADTRFFRREGPFKLEELAKIASAQLDDESEGQREFKDVAPISDAGPEDLTFLDNRRYAVHLAQSRAGACILHPSMAERAPKGMALILSKEPYRAYASIAQAFYPTHAATPGIHPSAIVSDRAEISDKAAIGPGAVIGDGVKIGDETEIGANTVIGQYVEIGERCVIGANCALTHCLIGARVHLHAGVCLGNRGFGFAMGPLGHRDVPQLGRVIVEDDVEIGANSTVDRGAGPDTVIGAGSKIDNLVQIGHNVRLGRGCVLVAQSGVAGSTQLDDFAVLAAQAGVAGHLRIGAGAQVGAQAGVMRDLDPGEQVLGSPAMPVKRFFRLVNLWNRMVEKKGKADE
jgi:UDP-3-O-[3-hydroxymyristoyl] glucosamine N-acyltransferase